MNPFAGLVELARTFPDAVLAGCVAAVVGAVLGVFVVLKRVVFVTIALSEVAACGIAAALVVRLSPWLGASVLTALAAVALGLMPARGRLSQDAFLGTIFVGASSLSLLLVAHSGIGLTEVRALLYGDLILTSPRDRNVLLLTLLPAGGFVLLFLRPLLYTSLDREAAAILGLRVRLWELGFFLALGVAVSAASKICGALLTFAYLVVTPAAALLLCRRLSTALWVAAAMAVATTVMGLGWAYQRDLPANQTIALGLCLCLAAGFAFNRGWQRWRR